MKTVWIDRIDMCGKIRPHNTWRKVDVPDKANYITASDTGYIWHELNPAFHELTKEWHSDGDRGVLCIGIEETPQNISNKIARGTFGAIFMLQVMTAIGCDEFRLG